MVTFVTRKVTAMKLITTTDIPAEYFGYDKAIDMIADAGFDGLDFSAFGMTKPENIFNSDKYLDFAAKIREKAESRGLFFAQAHAPFPTTQNDEKFNSDRRELIIRSMEIASVLGVGTIVVHPVQHLKYKCSVEELYRLNMEFYRSLIPICEKLRIRVATENMWQFDKYRNIIDDSVCASPEEFSKYIDDLDSWYITGCLDLGHCGLSGREAQDMLRYMGKNRVTCLHIHDNDYLSDLHTLPGAAKMNWDEILRAIAEIGYEGNFTYECDMFMKRYGPALAEKTLGFMHDVGRYMISKIEEYKK